MSNSRKSKNAAMMLSLPGIHSVLRAKGNQLTSDLINDDLAGIFSTQ